MSKHEINSLAKANQSWITNLPNLVRRKVPCTTLLVLVKYFLAIKEPWVYCFEITVGYINCFIFYFYNFSRLQKFTQKPSVIPEPTVFSQPSSIPQPDIFSQPNLISQPCSTSQPTFFSQPNIISQPNIFSQPNFTPQPNVVTSNEPDDERELRLHLEEVLSSKHFPEYELQVSAYLTGSGRVDPDLAASVNRCLMNDRYLINKMKIILIKKMKNSSL